MLSSITPLGERSKSNRYWVTVTAHIVGGLVGGALLGTLAGALGGALRMATGGALDAVAAIGVAASLASVVDMAAGGRRLSPWRRQVNEQWLDEFRGWVYGLGFGVQLGVGLATIVTSATTYAAMVAMVFQRSFVGAVLVGSLFGLVRGLVVLAAAGVDRPARLSALHRRMSTAARPAATTAAVAAGAVGLGAIALAATGTAT